MTTALGAVFLHAVREMEKNDGGGGFDGDVVARD